MLATIPVKGRAPKTGYARDQFGQAWADSRPQRLRHPQRHPPPRPERPSRSSPAPGTALSCSGTLTDPYTATTITFLRGEEHQRVPSRSTTWSRSQRRLAEGRPAARRGPAGLFANDPLNLLAVDGPANQQKSDGDAATWLPPNKSYRCDYVARQISVKAGYGLWVTQAEHDAMARVLADCRTPPLRASQARPGHTGGRGRRTRPAAAPAPAPAAPRLRHRRVLRELRRRPCRRRRAAAGRPAGLPRKDGRRPRRHRLRIGVLSPRPVPARP